MAVYNCAATLPVAIRSVLEQTYTDWEFVICNDGSTDNTQEILDSFANEYPERFILLSNEKNMYLSYSLNRCLEVCKGEYIARMDGDDLSRSDRFEKQVSFLDSHPEFAIVGTSMQRFSDEGLADVDYAMEKPDRFSLKRKTPYFHATIMMRKTAYDALNGYTVSKRTIRGQDIDLWFRFYSIGLEGDNLQEALYMVREDQAAIRRRTWKVRWNIYKTTIYGFKLLKYPVHWFIKPTIDFLLKSLAPYFAIDWYRAWQKRTATAKNL